MALLQQFADLLSVITISLCFILKIPQILNLISLKSANEISIKGLVAELISYTLMTSYNFANNYSLLSYLEYPIIIVQQYILIFLVLKYSHKINLWSFSCAIIYFTLSRCLLLGTIPKSVLDNLVPICMPLSTTSKICQLQTILETKNAESISLLTWFLSCFTNLTRVFTILVESADVYLAGYFLISSILSLSIMASAFYYKYRPLKQE
ncbi:PREDICTED: PQ-loop repeat-containing protein 3 [Cyphomyrmex costatus]|uniref:PQ-loop repeat-containing protein 3 n=1 Tax=Cyphomyrmex costatus TaxID=456900 RepID=A0A195CB71_9HYME|nr:PREDICTED: PQ-loop repeat-containing protein 3 [Cyphomyrmex costatus]KYM98052.1 PQ-loop repeat-containing protein 3 [Cyphomyrmex costatus]